MKNHTKHLPVVFIIVTITLSSCNLPTTYTPTPVEQYAAYTEAAETIAAQLTQIANPFTPSPTMGDSAETKGAVTAPSTQPALETLPPTSTPLPTDTPIPTDTPVPTATLPPTATSGLTNAANDPVSQLGEPDWHDSFTNPNNWPIYADEHVVMEIQGGQLKMTALKADKWDSWMVSTPVLSDFYLETTGTTGECKGLDRYGLIARAAQNASQTYVFGFSCDGKYSIRIWNGEKYLTLAEWTPSNFINSGANKTNRLGVMARGDKLSIYANGNLLIEITDETFTEGAFGPFIGSVNTPEFTVLFDEISYWDLAE